MKKKQKTRKRNSYKRRVTALERELQQQSIEIAIILSFCRAVVFHDEKNTLASIMSYKVANCPFPDECEKFFMLFEKLKEFG